MNEAPRTQPILETARLRLRPFEFQDADLITSLLNCREIAAMTRSIDFPYEPAMAQTWLEGLGPSWASGEAAVFAICERTTSGLIGAIGLEVCEENHLAELGYWVGREYWGCGFATEAAQRIIQFGFEELGLNRIVAHHMIQNPASGRVLEKSGFVHEGTLRRHYRKWGKFHDAAIYGVLVEEWRVLMQTQ
jgi:RimJ/RimL family protein N-acetyltransferase